MSYMPCFDAPPMNAQKSQYLDRIRSHSAYPWVRRIAGLVALFFYTLGMISIFAGLIATFTGNGGGGLAIILGGIFGIIYFVVGGIIKELSIMLADIADFITDLNCRYETAE
jgi:hypothetical protein